MKKINFEAEYEKVTGTLCVDDNATEDKIYDLVYERLSEICPPISISVWSFEEEEN